MKTFLFDYYKTTNLSPDELNAMRRNQKGVWLCGPSIAADSARKAFKKARSMGYKKVRLNAHCN